MTTITVGMLRELLALADQDSPIFAMQAGRPIAFGAPKIERRRFDDQHDGYALNIDAPAPPPPALGTLPGDVPAPPLLTCHKCRHQQARYARHEPQRCERCASWDVWL